MQTPSPRGLSHEMRQDGGVTTNSSLHPVFHSMNSGAKKQPQPRAPQEEGGLKECKPKKIHITQQKSPKPRTYLS